jgi:hypothetical protein
MWHAPRAVVVQTFAGRASALTDSRVRRYWLSIDAQQRVWPGGGSQLAAGPNPDVNILSATSARRTRQNRLTRHRRSGRRWGNLLPLTGIVASHLQEWSAGCHRSTDRHRRAHRHRRNDRNRRSERHRRSDGRSERHRRSERNGRNTHGHRRNDRNRRSDRYRPGQGHRNTGHVVEWSAGRTARGRCRIRTSTLPS